MTVYVFRNNKLVVKRKDRPDFPADFTQFPTPRISRIEPYESPITGKEISSWRERERELNANDCYDPRDYSGPYAKGRASRLKEADNGRERHPDVFEWRDPA